jgi:hypothetical protein
MSASTIKVMPSSAAPKKPVAPVQKEDAMWLQKELINQNYHELATAHAMGRKVSATFVPGNLNELLMCFDFARSLPETNALQNGMRKKSGKMIMDAERDGHSEDVTRWAKYTSANETVSQVDDNGQAKVVGFGEGAITAWYLSRIDIGTITVPYTNKVVIGPHRRRLELARADQQQVGPFVRPVVDKLGRCDQCVDQVRSTSVGFRI